MEEEKEEIENDESEDMIDVDNCKEEQNSEIKLEKEDLLSNDHSNNIITNNDKVNVDNDNINSHQTSETLHIKIVEENNTIEPTDNSIIKTEF